MNVRREHQARPDALILLVDDEEAFRFQVAECLAEENVVVEEAADGAEALEKCHILAPDLVLLDVKMQGMDGFEVYSAIRALPGGHDTAVVMVTGSEDFHSLNRALEVGATDFVTKPVNWPLLVHRLRYVLRAHAAFRDLRDSERRLAQAQRIAHIGSWDRDFLRDTMYWSPEVYKILGLPMDTVPDYGTFLELVHPDDREAVRRAFFEAVHDRRPYDLEHLIRGPRGEYRRLHAQAEVVFDETGDLVSMHGTILDVTRMRRNEDRIHRLAYYDTLTGLPNRQFFREHAELTLAGARRRQEKSALMFLDLDRFKEINDSFGHEVGDELLRVVAACLVDSVRHSDMVAQAGEPQGSMGTFSRLGGDEFAFILSGISLVKDVAGVAERILGHLRTPMSIGGHQITVSGSLGIALYPDDGDGLDELLNRADIAMYHAKAEGRNRFRFFSPEMNFGVMERLELEAGLREALDRGELPVRYQPFVDRVGALVGIDARLFRVNGKGAVALTETLDRVQSHELLLGLSRHLLGSALASLAAWDRVPRLLVRLPSAFLGMPERQAVISGLLAEQGLGSDRLEIIVSEELMGRDREYLARMAGDLKSLGISLALGSHRGYCLPLPGIRRMALDRIIIGGDFVAGDPGVDQTAMTTAVVHCAIAIGLPVMAEDLENEERLEFFRAHGCHHFKGDAIQPFLNVEEMGDFLAQNVNKA